MEHTRVLVVDDSSFMRHAVARLLNEAPGIEVVGNAANGQIGLEMARQLKPDVVTLDVEMPVLDGLGMLRRLMTEQPTRVIMLSSLTTDGAAVTMDALASGAVDFVAKPSGSLSIDIGRVGEDLVAKIHAAAGMSHAAFLAHCHRTISRSRPAAAPTVLNGSPAGRSDDPRATSDTKALRLPQIASRYVVVVASSTGGPAALQTLVSGLPDRLGAGMVIVQHMPPGFTASLAGRLNTYCRLGVTEAAANDVIGDDHILLAPGDHHLISSAGGRVQLVRLPPVNGVRPAADVTLQSLAPVWRERMLAVVLTGMGSDGTNGALAVKKHGGTVLAQDEASATIYGMPRAVAEAGLADRVLSLDRMAGAIADWAAAAVRGAASTGRERVTARA